jgi:putative ABC transport system substrate-binding protein
MRRREFIVGLSSAAASPLAALAQKKVATIGFMGAGAADTTAPLLEALKQGLRENGLNEGKDYVLEARWAEGHYERFPAFARELADKGARVIIITTIAAWRAAQNIAAMPIVMASINDPVGNGLVASLSHPGGNTTGMANLNEDVMSKLVEFFRTVLPNATKIAVLFNPTNPSNEIFLERIRALTTPLRVEIQAFALNTPDGLDAAFVAVSAKKPDALLVIPDAATLDLSARIAAHSVRYRIPIISTYADLTYEGGLVSYGFSRRDNYRRSAYFVKKILDGVSPADLPVEQPTRILLSVNLKTAKALGLTIPPSMLTTADEVIE